MSRCPLTRRGVGVDVSDLLGNIARQPPFAVHRFERRYRKLAPKSDVVPFAAPGAIERLPRIEITAGRKYGNRLVQKEPPGPGAAASPYRNAFFNPLPMSFKAFPAALPVSLAAPFVACPAFLP